MSFKGENQFLIEITLSKTFDSEYFNYTDDYSASLWIVYPPLFHFNLLECMEEGENL